jgi:selT/selW/selH-like putative selenoprotein
LAAEIKQQLGEDVELVRGSTGAFNVIVDDRLIFSKHQSGRFPDSGEIIARIRRMAGDAHPSS